MAASNSSVPSSKAVAKYQRRGGTAKEEGRGMAKAKAKKRRTCNLVRSRRLAAHLAVALLRTRAINRTPHLFVRTAHMRARFLELTCRLHAI